MLPSFRQEASDSEVGVTSSVGRVCGFGAGVVGSPGSPRCAGAALPAILWDEAEQKGMPETFRKFNKRY